MLGAELRNIATERFYSRLAADGDSLQRVLDLMKSAAVLAGEYILSLPRDPQQITLKRDGSITTSADVAAEALIRQILMPSLRNYKFVGEESAESSLVSSKFDDSVVFIDPLDGTREYYANQPDYTVNIGVVVAGQPVCGVIFAPAHKKIYWGSPEGSYKADVDESKVGPIRKISVLRQVPPVIITSRSRGSTPAIEAFTRRFADPSVISLGSSLKFCRIAEGLASYYPCFGDTFEWDTAAGQAILEAAGGSVKTLNEEPLSYCKGSAFGNKNYLNPNFVASMLPRNVED